MSFVRFARRCRAIGAGALAVAATAVAGAVSVAAAGALGAAPPPSPPPLPSPPPRNSLPPNPPPRNSQVQVARRFWRAVLRPDDRAAYALLTPSLRRTLPLAAFRHRARQVRAAAHGRAIELYKLGFRLEDNGRVRPFVAFTYAADSAATARRVLLDVTFRDTAARAVWRFEAR